MNKWDFKGTPAPWLQNTTKAVMAKTSDQHQLAITDVFNNLICGVNHDTVQMREFEANANLIFSAPDLLIASMAVVQEWADIMGGGEDHESIMKLKQAINKALGKL